MCCALQGMTMRAGRWMRCRVWARRHSQSPNRGRNVPMADARLKATLRDGGFIVAPGIFDMISTRVADAMGFTALYATGFGTVASHLGIADAGIATYSDMVGRVGAFAQASKTPVIADADTGYGGLLNVRNTVAGYEAAGIAAIQIEDQELPKKCGHTP